MASSTLFSVKWARHAFGWYDEHETLEYFFRIFDIKWFVGLITFWQLFQAEWGEGGAFRDSQLDATPLVRLAPSSRLFRGRWPSRTHGVQGVHSTHCRSCHLLLHCPYIDQLRGLNATWDDIIIGSARKSSTNTPKTLLVLLQSTCCQIDRLEWPCRRYQVWI